MPGYIESTTDEALYESYSGGRESWAGDKRLSGMGQWSAVNDQRTCDFCGWADDRIFSMDKVEWDPPVHWGCRCLVGYILSKEDPGPATWGKGPPDSSFPPGIRNGMKKGKPTLRQAGKKPIENPMIKRAQQAAKRWQRKLFHWGEMRNGKRGATEYLGAHVRGSKGKLKSWHRQAVRDVMGTSFDAEASSQVDYFLKLWVTDTPQRAKVFAEAVARGTADDALKALKEWGTSSPWIKSTLNNEIKTKAQMEAFQAHWEAYRQIAIATAKRSGIVNADGTVTLYRGVKTTGHYKELGAQLAAGDTEFAVATNFMSSWSANFEVAKNFATQYQYKQPLRPGIVFVKRVPVDDIFVGFFENPNFSGFFSENEVLWYNWDSTIVPKTTTISRIGTIITEVH